MSIVHADKGKQIGIVQLQNYFNGKCAVHNITNSFHHTICAIKRCACTFAAQSATNVLWVSDLLESPDVYAAELWISCPYLLSFLVHSPNLCSTSLFYVFFAMTMEARPTNSMSLCVHCLETMTQYQIRLYLENITQRTDLWQRAVIMYITNSVLMKSGEACTRQTKTKKIRWHIAKQKHSTACKNGQIGSETIIFIWNHCW